MEARQALIRAAAVALPLLGGEASRAQILETTPTVASISPASAVAGGPGFTLSVFGTDFALDAEVRWNGSARPTSFVDPGRVDASIPASDIAAVGVSSVAVANTGLGGGVSNSAAFTAGYAVPDISDLVPNTAPAGGPGFSLTVYGTDFAPSAVVRWNGSDRPTTFLAAGRLRAAVSAADVAAAGTWNVTVFNPAPGGGESAPALFTTTYPAPQTSGLNPNSATVGAPAFTLQVTGAGFVPASSVLWNGSARPTTFVSASQVSASVPASDVASTGTFPVSVSNPSPGGGVSNAQSFTVSAANPVPQVSGLIPNAATAGGASFTLNVFGSGFVPGAAAFWDGSGRPTAWVSSSQLQVSLSSADVAHAGSFPVTVSNPAPGGGLSNPQPFSVSNPAPSLASISPSSAVTGTPGASLAVSGSGFAPDSVVRWNGADRPTAYLGPTQLSAALSASDLAAAGVSTVTVFNRAPGGGLSGGLPFTTYSYPVPAIAALSPSSATAGAPAFTLQVTGSGFVPSSTVQWGGPNRPTTYVSPTLVRAAIAAADVANARSVAVTVTNPSPGGGVSNAAFFSVAGPDNPAPLLSSISPSSAAAGSPSLNLSVRGSSFQPSSTVDWDGQPLITTFLSSSALAALIPAPELSKPRQAAVNVATPPPGGGASAPRVFTVVPAPSAKPAAGKAYPNPWRATSDAGRPVTFSLPASGEVKIFTLSGRWVRTVAAPSGVGNWDLNNDAGQAVASGVYLFTYSDGAGGRGRGVLALVR